MVFIIQTGEIVKIVFQQLSLGPYLVVLSAGLLVTSY